MSDDPRDDWEEAPELEWAVVAVLFGCLVVLVLYGVHVVFHVL